MKKGKALFLLAILGLALSVFSGCSAKGKPLPSGMDEEELKTAATKLLTLAHDKDYETLNEYLNNGAGSLAILPESFNPIWERVGAFKSFGEASVTGDAQRKDGIATEYGVVLVPTEYEKGRIIWQVVYDADSVPVGIFIAG